MNWRSGLERLREIDMGDLDASNPGAWPLAVRATAMALALALILGGGHWAHLAGRGERLEFLERREGELRSEYWRKAALAADLKARRAQKAQMETAFAALLRHLPGETEVPGLVEDITRAALGSGLVIRGIDLQSERPTAFYAELPIEILVEGGYHRIGAFVSAVAALPRIVTLHDFAIEPAGATGRLKMRILAKTYRYLERGEQEELGERENASGRVPPAPR